MSAWAGASLSLTKSVIQNRLGDSGYRFVIHPLETAAGYVSANLTFGFDPGDLRRYGIDMTGAADAHAIINAALAIGVPVQIPPGTVLLTAGITIPPGGVLLGAGTKLTTINHTGATAGISFSGSDATPVELGGFQLKGSAAGTAGLYCGGNLRRSYIHDIYVDAYTGVGVFGVDLNANLATGGIYYNKFARVGVSGCANGWRIYSSDGAANGNRNNANSFSDCYAQFCTGDGFFTDYADNTYVNCDREANGGYGFNSDHCLAIAIFGGYSEANTSGGINKTANGNLYVVGRVIDGFTGVWFDTDHVISGANFGIDPAGNLVITGAAINCTNSPIFQSSGANLYGLDGVNLLNHYLRGLRIDAATEASVANALNLSAVKQSAIEVSLAQNITAITMPASVDGFEIEILFKQGAGGPYTVAGWPAGNGAGGVQFAGGAFAVTATVGKFDRVKLRYSGAFARWQEISRALDMS